MSQMKPFIKWILFGFAALLLLGVALVVAVVLLVDPARYRVVATDAVQQATGRTLTLGGDVGLKLFPCCAVEFDQATLGNPPGFSGEPFLHVESAELAIRLWPLLSRREVEIGTVRLDGLKANLTGRKDGSNNWTFSGAADASGVDGSDGSDGSGGAIAGISVAGISIRDAGIDYSDEADGSRYRIEQLQLTTGPLRGAAPFDFDTFLRFTDLSDNSGGAVALKATTSVAVDGDVTRVRLSDLDGELDLKGLGGLDALTGRLRSPALDVRMASDTLLSASKLTMDLQLAGADLPGGSASFKAGLTNFSYAVDSGAGTTSALTATTTLAGISLDVTGAGSFGASNDLRGSVRIPAFSPRNLLAALKEDVPVTADPGALTRFSGSANWFLKDKAAGVDKLAIILDDTKIAGSLSQEVLPEGSQATPRTRFDLTMDALNADRYLKPDGPPPAKGADEKTPPTEIPAETLRGLNLEGRARVGRLTLDGMQLADVDVAAKASGGRVQLEPLAARLYGGSFGGAIRLDATGPKSRLTLDQTASGVDFGALLTDLADVRNITGTMSLTLDGTAVGSTDDELLENLGGTLTFTLADGVYQGMDVWYEIRKARALLRRTEAPPMSEPEQTQIKALDLTGKISDGKLRTDRFNAEIPFLRVSGDTTVDFLRGSLDSKLTALVFEKPVFGDDASLADLEGVRIPLTVSGPVDDPKVRVDLSKMVKGALKEALRDTLLDKLGLGKPAEEVTAEGEGAAPAEKKKEDPVKKALDRIFR